MAFWPFRRKSRRKRASGTTANVGSLRGRATDPLPPGRSQTEPQGISHGDSPTLGRQGHEPNKLQRRARAYSFSPGRDESLQVDRTRPGKGRPRAGPPLAPVRGSRKHKALDKEQGGNMYDEDYDELFRVPTLHSKRDGDHLPRKKSSKKRRKDNDREAEIKAMSNFMPVRPAAEDWAGRPIRKDTKRARPGGFGLRMGGTGEWDKEHRSSDISLPTQESIHSAMSSDSEHISFRVGVFEALAPRPTLRYASHPRAWTTSGGGGGLSQRPNERRRFSEKEPIPEATIKAHKRVDDLADDFSASDLRELMERDQRRRDKKRLKEQERLERHLMRQVERHGMAEAHAIAQGRESPPNLERGVLGRESIGLGIDPASAVVTSSRRRGSDASPRSRKSDEDNFIADEKVPHPLDTFHRTDSIPLDSPIRDPEKSAPFSAPSPGAGLGRLRSRSPQASEVTTETYATPRKVSDGSISKSWTSFFKWGKNKRVLSAGPSSFSNTSRDSMQNSYVPAAPVSAVPRRVSSGVPKRTMSRFREDLPEFPLSPPDSRIQSPEVEMIPPTIEEASPDPGAHVEGFTFTHSNRNDTPVSTMDMVRGTPSPSQLGDPGVSPEPGQAMSLASMDSEGSWLSGRMGKRASSALARTPTPLYNLRDDEEDTPMENTSIAEENDGSRSPPSRTTTGLDKTVASSDEEDEDDARWGSVRGAQPVLIHGHSAERMKSREVLLNYDEDDEGNEELGMGDVEDIGVQRATSVNLGQGHARRVSAGSARLLDVTPRHSIDKARSRSPRI